jgi:hypothetical protein
MFKLDAAARLTAHYAVLTRDLSKAIASVKRIQEKKRQMLAGVLSLFLALAVGIANLFSRFAWSVLSPELGHAQSSSASGRSLTSEAGVVAGAQIVSAVRAVEAVVATGTTELVHMKKELEMQSKELRLLKTELGKQYHELERLNHAVVPVCNQISGESGGGAGVTHGA